MAVSTREKWAAPKSTALLLIDFINPLNLAGASHMHEAVLGAARTAARLKHAAHRVGLMCVYVNDHFDDWHKTFADVVAAVSEGGPVSREIATLLAPSSDDISILKLRHSAFYGTPIEFLFEEQSVKRLILTGIATDNCVFATAQDAYVRKFDLWIPSDCVACHPRADQRAVLRHMARTMKARIGKSRGYLA